MTCPICLLDIGEEGGVSVCCCKNSMHLECVTRWAEQTPTCPMCRSDLWLIVDYRKKRDSMYAVRFTWDDGTPCIPVWDLDAWIEARALLRLYHGEYGFGDFQRIDNLPSPTRQNE